MLFRCPDCRTRRRDFGLFTQHIKATGHALCRCGGYHYSHRPGSPFCFANTAADVNHASRAGEPPDVLADIALSVALAGRGKPSKACPF